MQTDKGLTQAFVVAGEAAEACHPGEAAFDDPASGQEDEAALGGGQLDDLEADAVLVSGYGGLFASVALVDKGDFDGIAGSLLHLGGQFSNLRSFLFVGGRDS